MAEYIFGANILENLTTGMYQDSKVIYREYIQNACDQIDKAVRIGLLKEGDGKIEIWLDTEKRTITIEDNATGISAEDFQRVLGNIADSDKKIGEDKGFRGIGRLCGLAYCEKLIFSSSAQGENTVSVLTCDARKMRELIVENGQGAKYKASDVLNQIYNFSSEKTTDVQKHFFKVEMIGINKENTDLLSFQLVKDNLAFVAPVPYKNTFIFRKKVDDHARQLGTKIDEYVIKLNGESIFKNYVTTIKLNNEKNDDIFDVEFFDFYDSTNNNLLCWMWIGLSKFRKAIPAINQMRGLRLRKANIQIGNADALQNLFKEERGNNYFVGEVFAVHKDLIPNSQRDYFNENSTRVEFESQLRKRFDEEFTRMYRFGSEINKAYETIDSCSEKAEEFQKKKSKGDFVSKEHESKTLEELQQKKEDAERAQKTLAKAQISATNNATLGKIYKRIEAAHNNTSSAYESCSNESEDTDKDSDPYKRKIKYLTDQLPRRNKQERKLISKIFDIILSASDLVDAKTADLLNRRIVDSLQ